MIDRDINLKVQYNKNYGETYGNSSFVYRLYIFDELTEFNNINDLYNFVKGFDKATDIQL